MLIKNSNFCKYIWLLLKQIQPWKQDELQPEDVTADQEYHDIQSPNGHYWIVILKKKSPLGVASGQEEIGIVCKSLSAFYSD
jgi:hypothetical protein